MKNRKEDMMDCSEVKMKLNRMIDQELSDEICSHIEKHLENCSECNLEYQNLLDANNFLSEYEDVAVPQNLLENIFSSADKIEKGKFYHSKKFFLAMAASFVLFFSIGGFLGKTTFVEKQNSSELYSFSLEAETFDINFGEE